MTYGHLPERDGEPSWHGSGTPRSAPETSRPPRPPSGFATTRSAERRTHGVSPGSRLQCMWSALTVDGDLEGDTDLVHPAIAQSAEAVHEHGHRDALDRVEVDGAEPGHRVVGRIEHDL